MINLSIDLIEKVVNRPDREKHIFRLLNDGRSSV